MRLSAEVPQSNFGPHFLHPYRPRVKGSNIYRQTRTIVTTTRSAPPCLSCSSIPPSCVLEIRLRPANLSDRASASRLSWILHFRRPSSPLQHKEAAELISGRGGGGGQERRERGVRGGTNIDFVICLTNIAETPSSITKQRPMSILRVCVCYGGTSFTLCSSLCSAKL